MLALLISYLLNYFLGYPYCIKTNLIKFKWIYFEIIFYGIVILEIWGNERQTPYTLS